MQNPNNTQLILASKSPRRQELLKIITNDFEIITSDMDEVITSTKPSDVVEELSLQKASNVFDMLLVASQKYNDVYSSEDNLSCIVIGSDTIVAKDDLILGKPKDKNDAYEMLRNLSGKTHQVYTGVTLIKYNYSSKTKKVISFHECTDVTFNTLTDEEIWDYISTGDCMDKAGSYGIQGIFAKHVAGINGDYNNVVGLPVSRLYSELKHLM